MSAHVACPASWEELGESSPAAGSNVSCTCPPPPPSRCRRPRLQALLLSLLEATYSGSDGTCTHDDLAASVEVEGTSPAAVGFKQLDAQVRAGLQRLPAAQQEVLLSLMDHWAS